MLMPQLNAFIVAELAENEEMCWGRVVSMFVGHLTVTLGISVGVDRDGVMQTFTITCPPWRLLHCHHQPADLFNKTTGKLLEPAADDSAAWRETREAVARACMKCGPHAKRFFQGETKRSRRPPKESA